MLTVEHFSALKVEIMAALSKEVPCAVRKAMSPWMDRASAAAYLQVSMDTLDTYRRQGKLRARYVGLRGGGKPVYRREDLDKLPRKEK